jgi:hypothetical protein
VSSISIPYIESASGISFHTEIPKSQMIYSREDRGLVIEKTKNGKRHQVCPQCH